MEWRWLLNCILQCTSSTVAHMNNFHEMAKIVVLIKTQKSTILAVFCNLEIAGLGLPNSRIWAWLNCPGSRDFRSCFGNQNSCRFRSCRCQWNSQQRNFCRSLDTQVLFFYLTLPYHHSGRLLHLPSAEAVSVWPSAHSRM